MIHFNKIAALFIAVVAIVLLVILSLNLAAGQHEVGNVIVNHNGTVAVTSSAGEREIHRAGELFRGETLHNTGQTSQIKFSNVEITLFPDTVVEFRKFDNQQIVFYVPSGKVLVANNSDQTVVVESRDIRATKPRGMMRFINFVEDQNIHIYPMIGDPVTVSSPWYDPVVIGDPYEFQEHEPYGYSEIEK